MIHYMREASKDMSKVLQSIEEQEQRKKRQNRDLVEELLRLWDRSPNLRFGQLVHVVARRPELPSELFYISDEDFKETISNWVSDLEEQDRKVNTYGRG